MLTVALLSESTLFKQGYKLKSINPAFVFMLSALAGEDRSPSSRAAA